MISSVQVKRNQPINQQTFQSSAIALRDTGYDKSSQVNKNSKRPYVIGLKGASATYKLYSTEEVKP